MMAKHKEKKEPKHREGAKDKVDKKKDIAEGEFKPFKKKRK